ncbi:quinol monooxygenase YgiN [Dysgonomonas alginatilytica]|uniref:Quinol monooxygenase YgiN n=1 Tax=Dysgonomonas alginatilytica TaxID=1605892 RepID=A0A2V3PS26_9BACT|nr:putative quinol monooxygenase [Dysgonomonas alginatilytica]PXV67980.1 quinol monooxygenase YgiN [Dysgonomonas alginatilytica]
MDNRKVESTVILKCKTNKIQEFRIAVAKLVNETVKEPGCEIFRIFQNNAQPDEFILWEIFKDAAALDIHMKAAHTQECFSLGLFEVVSATHHTEVA